MAASVKPTVSIGVPVYNGANFIEDCLLCLLQQTWDDLEIVISDNASTDETEEICQTYVKQDPRVRYFRSSVNRGAAWNFNQVFQLSRGRYFRWAAHDDLCAPTHTAQCLDVLQSDASVVLCGTQVGIVDGLGREVLGTSDAACAGILAMQGLTADGERKRIVRSASCHPAERFRGILINSLRCYEVYGFMRRECMERSIGHPNYCSGDKVWLAQMALMGRLHELPEKLFFSRWHDSRFSCNSSLEHQNEHMDPERKVRRRLPHQLRSTIGYAHVIGSVPMSGSQRMHCWLAWLAYFLQVRKLMRITSLTISGAADSVHIPANARFGPCPVQMPSRKFLSREHSVADSAYLEPTLGEK